MKMREMMVVVVVVVMMMMIGDWLMEVVVARISNCIYEFTVQC